MTTIAADREGMASDSRMTDDSAATMASVPKFWRVRGWLVGGAGDYSTIIHLVDTLKTVKEMSPKELLASAALKVKGSADLLLLSPGGKLYMSEDGGACMPVTDKFAALGTGAQGALVAMHMGATPAQAVRMVGKVDPRTGGKTITRKL